MAETVTAAAAAAFNQEQFDELKEELIEVLHHEDGWDFTWLFCFLVFVGVFVAITFVRRYFLGWVDKQTKKTDNVIDDFVVDMIERWTQGYVVAVFAAFVACQTYHISNVLDVASKAAFLGILTWRVIRSVEMGANFVMDQWVFQNTEEGKNLSANFHKGLRLCLYTAGAVFILDNCGLNISSLVAGFGIGGLAIALAAQAILGDTIASFTMFIDRPFVVGDAVTTSGYTGIVEHIGFKTTRIRALSGELIIFPNSTISSSTLQNFSRADHINQHIDVGVAVDTSDEMVRKIPSLLMDALQGQAGFDVAEVYFKEFSEYALVFEVRFSVKSNSPADIRAANGEVNTIINETCKKNSIDMPFRTEVVINKNGDL
jgi:small-conductance mechanosensitive channel